MFLLIHFEEIELLQVKRDELMKIKEEQKQENETVVEQQPEANQEVEEKMKKEKKKLGVRSHLPTLPSRIRNL